MGELLTPASSWWGGFCAESEGIWGNLPSDCHNSSHADRCHYFMYTVWTGLAKGLEFGMGCITIPLSCNMTVIMVDHNHELS